MAVDSLQERAAVQGIYVGSEAESGGSSNATAAYTKRILREPCVSLARYVQIIGHDECAFWGITYEGQPSVQCNTIWTESQRQMVKSALLDAQTQIEDYLRYPICPTWITGQVSSQPSLDPRFVDQQQWSKNQFTKWRKIIAAGVRAETTLDSVASVDYTLDPATVTVSDISFTDTTEVKVYYAGGELEITPSNVSISGTTLTIRIPRCRLLSVSLFSDIPPNSSNANTPDFETLDNFVTSVMVKRVYNDPSTNAVLVAPHTCGGSCLQNGCSEYTQTGCMYIKDPSTGVINVFPGTYSSGSWSKSTNTCCGTELVRLNYQAGLQYISPQLENAIVKLANTKMPDMPCLCGPAHTAWKEDRMIPRVLTRTRSHCPFGLENGAWEAWTSLRFMKEELRVGVF